MDNYPLMWNRDLGEYTSAPSDVQEFLKALEGIMQIYDISILHEDIGGAFILQKGFSQDSINWIKNSGLSKFDNQEEV